jgi:Protein of unknown function (DUF2510)
MLVVVALGQVVLGIQFRGPTAGPDDVGTAAGNQMRLPGRPPEELPGPGWYADPEEHHDLRFWDGGAWTEKCRDGNIEIREPLAERGWIIASLSVCEYLGGRGLDRLTAGERYELAFAESEVQVLFRYRKREARKETGERLDARIPFTAIAELRIDGPGAYVTGGGGDRRGLWR